MAFYAGNINLKGLVCQEGQVVHFGQVGQVGQVAQESRSIGKIGSVEGPKDQQSGI